MRHRDGLLDRKPVRSRGRQCKPCSGRRRCAVAFAMAAASAGAPASAQTAPAGTNLTMAVAAPVTSLDPHYHQLSPNNAVADMIFDRLVGTDAQARPIPGLATEWRAVEPNHLGVQAPPRRALPQRQPVHRRGRGLHLRARAQRAEQPVLLRHLHAADPRGGDRRPADHPAAHRGALSADAARHDEHPHPRHARPTPARRPRTSTAAASRSAPAPTAMRRAPQRRPHRVRAQRRLLGRQAGLSRASPTA